MTEPITIEQIAKLEVFANSDHAVTKGWVAIKDTQLRALLAAAIRDADVRTLDGQGQWELDESAEGWIVLGDDHITLNKKREATQVEARSKAAARVREQGDDV